MTIQRFWCPLAIAALAGCATLPKAVDEKSATAPVARPAKTAASSEIPVPTLGRAVEFQNDKLKQYFLTANPAEMAALDAGTPVEGWVRTGGEFSVFVDPAPGLAAVCRFLVTPGKGINAHFYTADAAECAQLKTNPGWTFEGIAFYTPLATGGACSRSAYPVMRGRSDTNDGDATYRYTVDATVYARMSGRGFRREGLVMCAPISSTDTEADVVRLLEQATFGPTDASIREVQAKGSAAWIEEQLALNTVTAYTQYSPLFVPPDDPTDCVDNKTPPETPDKFCHTYKIAPWPVGWQFYRQAKSAPDQLRLRMAHVWHQIFVVSDGPGTYAYAEFQQRLRDHVFGTFEELLTAYALSPFLGMYQNWLFNRPEHDGLKPNENFARELMQLFTIGVDELNEDGTPKHDAQCRTIPSYRQADIETLARILTGFGFAPLPGRTPRWESTRYFIGDMIPFETLHDHGAKNLLGGRLVLPPDGDAMTEVKAALHMLAEHPNTPAFISRQLIQKMVTSSPTPEYVGRVAAVFRDNGHGIRGDLTAVTYAILMDPEARGARKIDPEYGRLREPSLFWTTMIRSLNVTTDGVVPYEEVARSGQWLFLAPSVFNYYPADATLAGSTVPAPEFGIYGSGEFRNRANQVTNLLYNADAPALQSYYGPRTYVINATGTRAPNLAAYAADAGDTDRLIDRVDRLFLHGTMSPAMRKSIGNAIGQIPSVDTQSRVRLALRLTLSSVEYQIQK